MDESSNPESNAKGMAENGEQDGEAQRIVHRQGERKRSKKLYVVIGLAVLVLVAATFVGLVLAAINTDQSHTTFQQLQDSRNALYIRWGHKECPPTPGTSKIYQGFAASTYLTTTTSTTGSQCLPLVPNNIEYWNDTASLYGNTQVYTVHGMEYNTFLPDREHKGVACALCKVSTRSTVVMIPATKQCNSTDPTDKSWTREYNGYLMLASGAGSEYYCADNAMETISDSQQNSDVSTFSHVATGKEISPPSNYNYNKVLSCVVCSS